ICVRHEGKLPDESDSGARLCESESGLRMHWRRECASMSRDGGRPRRFVKESDMRCAPKVLTILSLLWLKGPASAQEPGRLELVLQTGHTSSVTSVALSGDGKHV